MVDRMWVSITAADSLLEFPSLLSLCRRCDLDRLGTLRQSSLFLSRGPWHSLGYVLTSILFVDRC